MLFAGPVDEDIANVAPVIVEPEASSDDLFLLEFRNHKDNYYMEKMCYKKIDK